MKRIFSTIIFALATLLVFSQNTEAVYNYFNKTFTRNNDGSTDVNVSFSLTLFTHTAMNNTYGQTYVIYNPDHQSVTINNAYTIQKNGKKVPLPERALTDVLPSWAAKASDFNHLKEKVIVHTGLDLGSTIYLDYTVHSMPGFNENFDFNEQIDASSPIKKLSYKLCVPEKMKLQQAIYSPAGEIKPSEDVADGGRRVVVYDIADIPARSMDAFQVTDLTKHYNFFCTASDFESELKGLFYGEIDPCLKTWADKIVDSEPSAAKRYEQIRNYVANEFSVVRVPLSVSGGLRSMSDVVRGAYITPGEQAAMLNQMLKACNIESDVLAEFDQTLPGRFRTLYNAKQFYVTQRMGEAEKTLVPSSNSGETSPSMVVGIGREIVKPDKGKELYKEYQLEVKQSDFNDKPYYMLELPANNAGVSGWGMGLLPTKREVDFEVPSLIEETEVYNIKVGEGIKPAALPTLNVANPATSVSMAMSCETKDDGTIVVKRSISVPQKVFTPQDYEGVRNVIMNWLDNGRRYLLFVKK
ncbi:MAG: DUF3857 domain-containing protein [Bacteroidaceae bacterium]|nr:DUF3857 domain-containing protein [Bacteroidaceae bacterium]